MKRIMMLVCALACAPAVGANETSVVEKVTGAVKKGAEATERGIKTGAEATERGLKTGAEAAERGLKKGGEAAARGVGKAGEWVGEKMQQGGEKMQGAAGRPETSAPAGPAAQSYGEAR